MVAMGMMPFDLLIDLYNYIYIYILYILYIYIIYYILYIYIYIYLGESGTKFKVGQWVSQECMQRFVWSISKSYMLYYAIITCIYLLVGIFILLSFLHISLGWWFHLTLKFAMSGSTTKQGIVYIYMCVYVSIYLILKISGWLVPPRFYVFYTSLHKIQVCVYLAALQARLTTGFGRWGGAQLFAPAWSEGRFIGRELVMVAKHMGFNHQTC